MRSLFIISFLVILAGCHTRPDSATGPKKLSETDLIEMNRSRIASDRKQITEYISKSDVSFTETATGLWYAITVTGDGRPVKMGDNVLFDYECRLLDGKPCYSGTKEVRIGYSDTESGITEGLQLMHRGDESLFIIPPYLAWGLTGDGNKIPGRSILVYHVRVKEVN